MEVSNKINDTEYNNGLQAVKLVNTEDQEVLLICLEKGSELKKHTTPKTAQLFVLEGSIVFSINDKELIINKHQHFEIPKDVIHWVNALENSKFLVTR